jgi:hypothetical protein
VKDVVMPRFSLALVIAAGAAVTLTALELKPHALESWNRYIALHDALLAENRADEASFLWIDRLPEDRRSRIMTELERGDVVVDKLELRDEDGDRIDIDDGKIHHWVGTVLIPGVTVDEVVAFVQDYARYPERFDPMIQRAEVLSREGDRWTVSMRNWTKKVITVVIDADYVVDYTRLSPTRYETMNVATNIFHVHDAGKADERRQAGDEADGYLWRFRMICRFDQRDEGTYEECESVSLTRGIPWLLRPIVSPFVNSVPKDTIAFNLGVVRDGVAQSRTRP